MTTDLVVRDARLHIGDVPPQDPSLYQPVQFTDYWTRSRRQQGVNGFYRLHVDVQAAGGEKRVPMGVYIANHSGRVTIFWDAEVIGRSVPLTGVGKPMVSGPLLLSIPDELLTAGTHELLIEFRGNITQTNFVRRPEVLPLNGAETHYVSKKLTLIYMPVSLGVLSMIFALVFYAAYFKDAAAGGVGWLVIGLVASACSVLGLYVSVPDNWADWLGRLRPIAFHLSFLCFWLALRSMADVKRKWSRRLLLSAYLVFAVLTLTVDAAQVYMVAVLWTPLTYALGLYVLYQALRLASRPPRRIYALLPLALVPVTIIHDALGIGAGGEFWADQALTVYNPPLFAFALMLMLVARTRMQQTDLRTLNAQLEQRVREKHAELEANYEKISAAEQREAVLNERERMVREMHDGLGNQLVSTLAMVESGQFSSTEIEEALRDALDDLRIMVHSLDQQETDLLGLLAIVRERLEPRLARQGLRFNWQVEDLPDITPLDPESAGHVLRIVQESLTNIIKHAHAETILIATRIDGDRRCLVIEDDGLGGGGFVAAAGGGRGLVHMRERAIRLGGELEVTNGPDGRGTRVTLCLPIVHPCTGCR
ncbi:MAG: sensor histidine kinase [bacterium]